jgi:hypothetical protein
MVVEWATYVCPMILFLFCFCNAGVKLGNGGIILVLFETPSGFAIFSYDGAILLQPNAIEVLYLSLPMHLSYSHGCLFVVVAFAIGLIFCVHVLQDIWADFTSGRRAKVVSAFLLLIVFIIYLCSSCLKNSMNSVYSLENMPFISANGTG